MNGKSMFRIIFSPQNRHSLATILSISALTASFAVIPDDAVLKLSAFVCEFKTFNCLCKSANLFFFAGPTIHNVIKAFHI